MLGLSAETSDWQYQGRDGAAMGSSLCQRADLTHSFPEEDLGTQSSLTSFTLKPNQRKAVTSGV